MGHLVKQKEELTEKEETIKQNVCCRNLMSCAFKGITEISDPLKLPSTGLITFREASPSKSHHTENPGRDEKGELSRVPNNTVPVQCRGPPGLLNIQCYISRTTLELEPEPCTH